MASKLRAVKPELIQKRLKAFWYGAAGVGKTTAAIQFPSCYLIDSERGAENSQYVKALRNAGGVHFYSNDLDEIIAEVRTLLTEKHPYKTLVIDPITIPYSEAVDRSARDIAHRSKDPNSDGTEFGRHKMGPDRAMKRLMALCTQLDMNVVMTAHSKGKWEKVGDKVEQVGATFDAYAKADFLFDLVLEVQLRGSDRVGVVRKTRIEAFPMGDIFPFDYNTIANRYGHEILERGAGIVALATEDQVAEIKHLIDVLKVDPEVIERWFTKANTDQFEEFSHADAAKVLAVLKAKIESPTPAASVAA